MSPAEYLARVRMMAQTMPRHHQILRLTLLALLVTVAGAVTVGEPTPALLVALAAAMVGVLATAIELGLLALDDDNFEIVPPETGPEEER